MMTVIDNDQQIIAYFKQLLTNLDAYHQSENNNLMLLHSDIIQNLRTIKPKKHITNAITPVTQLHAIYQSFANIAQLAQTLVSSQATALLNGINQSNKAILLQVASGDSSKLSSKIVQIVEKTNQVIACQLNDLSALQKLRLSYNEKTLAPDREYLHYLVSMLPKELIEPDASYSMQDLVSLQRNILTLNLETPLENIQNITTSYRLYLQRLSQELINFPQHENTITALLHYKKLSEVLAFPYTLEAIFKAMNQPKRLLVIDYALSNNLKQLHDVGQISLDQTSVQYLTTINTYHQHIKKAPYQDSKTTIVDYLEQLVTQSMDTPFKEKIYALQIVVKSWNRIKEYAQRLCFAPQFNQQLKHFGIT